MYKPGTAWAVCWKQAGRPLAKACFSFCCRSSRRRAAGARCAQGSTFATSIPNSDSTGSCNALNFACSDAHLCVCCQNSACRVTQYVTSFTFTADTLSATSVACQIGSASQ